MVLTGIVIGLTGHGTPYAFILGALLAIVTVVPYIILTVLDQGGGLEADDVDAGAEDQGDHSHKGFAEAGEDGYKVAGPQAAASAAAGSTNADGPGSC